jgi:hypothetical protein
MMIKIKKKDQLEIVGLEDWRNGYSLKKIALLEKSWALVFREYILPYIPVKSITKFYSDKTGRNSKELYSTIGAVILQQFFDLSDVETVGKLAFDQQWHVALDCFDEEDQVMCERTLFSMRTHISEENLADKIFAIATDVMVKALQIDVSKQRLDSVHVNSNMACLGRIRILHKANAKFLRNLKKKHPKVFKSLISEDLIEKYLTKDTDSCFNLIKPSERESNLQSHVEDLYGLIQSFQKNKKVSNMNTYKLLCRIFDEQCTVGDNKVMAKKPKEVPSDSVQNPSDLDAGYDGHKGQGFQTQLMESCQDKEERESSEPTKPDMILYAETESADKHDSNALEPAIKEVTERGHKCKKLLADAAYGGTKNTEKAEEYEIELISPTLGRTSEKQHESFKYDPYTYEVTSCLAGKKPDKLKHNKKGSITAIWYEVTCADCPHLDKCPAIECTRGRKGRKHYYTIDSIKCHFRRENEKSTEFIEQYRLRSGIEATNSRFISMTGGRRSRYRGLEKMRFSQKLKALAINMYRVTKYLRRLQDLVKIHDILPDFHRFCPLEDINWHFQFPEIKISFL